MHENTLFVTPLIDNTPCRWDTECLHNGERGCLSGYSWQYMSLQLSNSINTRSLVTQILSPELLCQYLFLPSGISVTIRVLSWNHSHVLTNV